MNPASPFTFSSTARSLRLRNCYEPIFEATSAIQRLYVHTRNPGAELAAIQPLGFPVVDEEQNVVLFPESGLNLNLGQLEAVHASRIDRLINPALGLEFDFQECSTALSLVALEESPDEGPFANALCRMGEAMVEVGTLNRWRAELDPPDCICPHCRQAADRRVEHAASHPLTTLLQDALNFRRPLLCRLQSPHLGMMVWMVPGRVKLHDGRIEMIDAGGHGLLQIRLQMAHSLWVLPLKIDGESFSAIRIYDMLGNLNLELATPDPAVADIWKKFCESEDSTYRADSGF